MEISGLVQLAFKSLFGNPDVMFFLIGFTVVITILFVILKIYDESSR
ncbi:MAG TPA: hypothetical protein GX525_12025 [Bacilli bacterium]|nr:hypothetical protein [Bacilli bacterium]